MGVAGWLVMGTGGGSLGVESPRKLNGFVSFCSGLATVGLKKGDESAVDVNAPKTDVAALGGCSGAVVEKGLAELEDSKPTPPKKGDLPKVSPRGLGLAGAPKLPEVACAEVNSVFGWGAAGKVAVAVAVESTGLKKGDGEGRAPGKVAVAVAAESVGLKNGDGEDGCPKDHDDVAGFPKPGVKVEACGLSEEPNPADTGVPMVDFVSGTNRLWSSSSPSYSACP